MRLTTRLDGISRPRATLSMSARWAGRILAASADQGLFSASNFVLNIALARWLVPSEYGAFAITYAILILLGNCHAAILTEPMLVYGSGKYNRQFSGYLELLLWGHWVILGGTSLVLALVSFVFWQLGATILALALAGLALALPAILLFWLVRRAFYVRLRPLWAAGGSALYFPLVLASVYALEVNHWLSVTSVLLVMGFVSLAVGVLLTTRLLSRPWYYPIVAFQNALRNPRFPIRDSRPGPLASTRGEPEAGDCTPRTVLNDHWHYARWALGTSVLGWLSSSLHYLVLGSTAGLEQVAAMRALDTVLMPYWLYLSATSQLTLPILVKASQTSPSTLRSVALRTTGLWIIQGVAAYAVIVSVGPRVIPLLYGATYAGLGRLLPQYGLVLILETGSTAIALIFRALTRTEMDFVYHVLLSGGILLGFVLTARYDVAGVISIRIVVSFCLLLIFALVALRILAITDQSEVNREH